MAAPNGLLDVIDLRDCLDFDLLSRDTDLFDLLVLFLLDLTSCDAILFVLAALVCSLTEWKVEVIFSKSRIV